MSVLSRVRRPQQAAPRVHRRRTCLDSSGDEVELSEDDGASPAGEEGEIEEPSAESEESSAEEEEGGTQLEDGRWLVVEPKPSVEVRPTDRSQSVLSCPMSPD